MIKSIESILYGKYSFSNLKVSDLLQINLDDKKAGLDVWLAAYQSLTSEMNHCENSKLRSHLFFISVQFITFLLAALMPYTYQTIMLFLAMVLLSGFFWCRKIGQSMAIFKSLRQATEAVESKLPIKPISTFNKIENRLLFNDRFEFIKIDKLLPILVSFLIVSFWLFFHYSHLSCA